MQSLVSFTFKIWNPYMKKCQKKNIKNLPNKVFFTVRRSEKHWSGVWSDMTIDQTLMRGIKTLGGLTHGRGFSESVLNKWILGLPAIHHVCEAVENYCDITSSTIDQHVEMRDARIQTDEQDRRKFEQWLREHSPFIDTNNLVSLATGYVTGDETNCYEAKRVGEEILQKSVSEASLFGALKLKRANTVKTMASSAGRVKVAKDTIQIDSTQLFQRIICTVHSPEDLRSCFKYELASVPLSLCDNAGLMRKTKKSSLYDVFNKVSEVEINTAGYHFVLDGGCLLHRMVWPKEGTFGDVYTAYANFIQKYYGYKVTVVFDGYSKNSISTKNV